MKRHGWAGALSALLLAMALVISAGYLPSGVSAAEEAGQVYTDENGNRFRVIPLGDGRYELWQLVDTQEGSGGETTRVDEKDCKHEHRKLNRGNDQFHWEECLDCGKLFPPETHVYNQTAVVKPATCTENAVLRRTCACGREESGNTAPKEGDPAEYFAHHTWGGEYESDFYTHWQRCAVCGERGNEQAHSVTNLQAEKEPTCLRDGRAGFDCPVCGAHVSADASAAMVERFPELAQYQALGHDYSGPLKPVSGPKKASAREKGTHAASCVRCGAADWEHAVPHSWTEQTIANGTCEDESDPVIIGGSCECGATLELKYTRHHEMVPDSSRDVQPTCREPGKINGHRCVYCGMFGDYEFAEPIGHDWIEDESRYVEPTCETVGEMHVYCSRCEDTQTWLIPTKSPYGRHIFVVKNVMQATCGETGWYQMVCKYCGENDGNGTVFEKLKHDNHTTTKTTTLDLQRLSNGTVVRPVVYETTITCLRCGKTRVDVRTVYKSIKGTGFKIVPGKNPGITTLEDGVHPSGQFAKDSVYFESEINRAMKKEIDRVLEGCDYD